MIEIPDTPKEIADLLYEHAWDWQATLQFLDEVAKAQNIDIYKNRIETLIHERLHG